ncbi:uncharacterized protein LOC122404472 [Colletes gigas]|uniref:uncharacterized protein LOC122404472 n=1 Tax=Colletes gigas TaxID=935657 RepID=UPI001C9A92AF|nr:uncharacterized protein LOC122404472 [Colletes gigas]
MSQHEAEAIKTVEARVEVVKSMERLYAVPSEMLRVWSVWLSQIGNIADEWQKWLRAHIDLVVRIAKQLEAMENASLEEKEDDKPTKVSSQPEYPTSDSIDSTEATVSSSVYVDALGDEDSTEIAKNKDNRADDEDNRADNENNRADNENNRTASNNGDVPMEQSDASKVTLTPELESLTSWPIGTPWQGSGKEEEVEEEEFEKIPIPQSEEEMQEFLKKFMHEATIYRSYYKHWRETADQATKVIGGRFVMATFIVQGKGKRVGNNSRKSRGSRKMSNKKSPSVATPTTEAPEQESTESKDEDEDEDESVTESPTVIEVAPSASKSKTEEPSNETIEQIVEKPNEWQEADDLLRDCARAAEPIPYFFYLKAEPDIEIALEHDDEEVIPADTDRENIVSKDERISYNLAEKPLKGGKPWI